MVESNLTFLSDDEVRRLTGRLRFTAQCRVLKEQGISYTTTATGRPIVMRGALIEQRTRPTARAKPNLEVW